MTPSADNRRLLAWFTLALTAVFLVTAGGTYPGIASTTGAIITQILAAIVLGGWLIVALFRPSWRASTPLLGPVLLAMVAWCFSALMSQRPRLSLEPTIAGLGFAVAFLFLTRLLAESWFRRRVGSLIVVGVAAVSVGYIVQVVALWIEWWMLVGTIALPPLRPAFASLTFGSPNLVATWLILTGPLGVAILAGRSRRGIAPIALAIVAVVALILTGSRGAYLGVGIGVVAVLALAARRVDIRRAGASAVDLVRSRPIVLAPVAVAAAAGVILAPVVARRFAQGGDSLRLDLWRSALTIFTDHPLTGGGPGTWVQLKIAVNPPGSPNVILQHAHDMYLQTAAEVGIVGLAALAILVFAVIRRLLRASRQPGPFGLEAGCVLVALAAFAGQSIVDNFVNLPSMVLPLLVIVAWVEAGLPAAASGASASPSWHRHVDPLFPIAGLVGLAIAVVVLIPVDRAGLVSATGNDAALRQDWATALDCYDRALALDPSNTLYQLERAGMLARIGRVEEARNQLTIAVQQDPVGTNVMTLAVLDLATGDTAAALAHAREALALGPYEPMLDLNAGIVAEAAGDRALALNSYADAVALDPALARSEFWTDARRTLLKVDVLGAARARTDPVTAAVILAYGDDPAAAAADLQTQPSSEARDVALATAAWLGGDPDAAIASLTARLAQDRGSWYTAGWLARIARLSGDPAAGDRYARLATIVEADAADFAISEQSVVPATPGDAGAGIPANYPWSVYLRPVPPFLYPPQLITIAAR